MFILGGWFKTSLSTLPAVSYFYSWHSLLLDDSLQKLQHLPRKQTKKIFSGRIINLQECIPVGCVPSAAVVVSDEGVFAQGECVCPGEGVYSGGVSAWGCLPWEGVFAQEECVCPGGVCLG